MRLIFFLVCVLFLNISYANVQINLNVTNQTASTATISYQVVSNSDDLRVFEVNLKNNESSSFYLDLERATFVNFEYSGFKIPMFLSPNENLTIQFDANNALRTLAFSGNASANNNYVAQLFRTIGSSQRKTYEYGYVPFSALEAVVQKYRNGNTNSQIKLLENVLLTDLNARAGLSASFRNYFKTYIPFELAAAKLAIAVEKENGRINVADYQRFVNLSKNQLSNSVHPSIANFYKAFGVASVLPADLYQYRLYNLIYDNTAKNLSGIPKLYALKEIMITAYNRSADASFVQPRFEAYLKFNTVKSYEKEIINAVGADVGTNEELSAPDVKLYTADGQYINLSKYRGKVIYLSFWASWCKPCIAGFKKSDGIRSELARLGVVLLNVSIDKTENAWRESMAKHNPRGVNVWADDLPDLATKYKITSIPLYHIIDKKGKFAYLSDSQNRDIYSEFKKLVNQ